MNQEEIWRELMALPSHAQKEVTDFIAFLRSRYGVPRLMPPSLNDVRDEPFIGIWKDHSDLTDSTAWVRATRRREWGEPGG